MRVAKGANVRAVKSSVVSGNTLLSRNPLLYIVSCGQTLVFLCMGSGSKTGRIGGRVWACAYIQVVLAECTNQWRYMRTTFLLLPSTFAKHSGVTQHSTAICRI